MNAACGYPCPDSHSVAQISIAALARKNIHARPVVIDDTHYPLIGRTHASVRSGCDEQMVGRKGGG